jgi:hypothetical protein
MAGDTVSARCPRRPLPRSEWTEAALVLRRRRKLAMVLYVGNLVMGGVFG